MPSFPSWLTQIGDWIFRVSAMRAARARVGQPSPGHDRAANQARLLVEVARRVAEPVEALPKGWRPAVLMGLYRDAAYWASVATGGPVDAAAAPDLAAGAALPADKVAQPESLVGEGASADAVRAFLLDSSRAKDLEATEQDVGRVRAVVDSLLWELEAPRRTVERVQVQRWSRIVAVGGLVAAAVFGARLLLRGPNLVAVKNFKTSSILPECTAPNKCGDIFFCTLNQESPWIDFDLGSIKTVRQVDVRNRSDCCSDRAVPLIVEVSLDDKQWTQVARRDADFSDWTGTFAKRKARYVRFRVPRLSLFHLDEVAIR